MASPEPDEEMPLTGIRTGITSNTTSVSLLQSEPLLILHLDHPLQQGKI